ncbi:hypothetical protein JCM10207_002405 [Rhodosporidiobolus poonsookiae]
MLLLRASSPSAALLTLNRLLIPKQAGTADTCETTHEEDQFAFQDARGLMTLGWIHTHPTQSCFLSSRDLHTHSGYQCMLAEAVAVVCAPRFKPAVGVFRMTDPPGLGTIMRCTTTGTFHEHPDLPLYTRRRRVGALQGRPRGPVRLDLPPELIDKIFALGHFNKKTLKKACLVCKRFLVHVQPVLYAHVQLVFEWQYGDPKHQLSSVGRA